MLLIGRDGDLTLVLAAYAVAINTAYISVKFACLEAGGSHARFRDPIVIRDHDLRRVEIVLSVIVMATSLALFLMEASGVAAVIRIDGYLGGRLLSRWSRDRLPGWRLEGEVKDQELLPMARLWPWPSGPTHSNDADASASASASANLRVGVKINPDITHSN